MRNPKAEHVDFGFLEGLIPDNPKWTASNVDMMFHRYNYKTKLDKFLVVEWKHPDERKMLDGQKRLLQALSQQKDFFVLLVIGYSKPGDVRVDKIYKVHKDGLKELGMGVEQLTEAITTWYIWASQ